MKEITKDFWDGLMFATKEISRVVEREGYQAIPACKTCGSHRVVRFGHKKGVQNWLCRECGHKFIDNKALPGMKVSVDATGAAVGMFYEGMSLNAIRRQLQQQYGIYPSDSTVYGWVTRYTKSGIAKASAQKLSVGDVWVADETVLKVNGHNTWYWDILDVRTRVLLASRLSHTRGTRDAKALVQAAAERAGKIPKVIVTDRLASYIDGIELAFGSDTRHIQAKTLTSEPAKQLIERFHGSLKDRTKVMRGLKSRESADEILNGWLVFYNFMRPHEGLKGQTPAEKAGVKFEYKNWLDVVKSSAPRVVLSRPAPELKLRLSAIRTPTGRPLTSAKHSNARKGGLFVSESGAMSRHYFRGAKRVRRGRAI